MCVPKGRGNLPLGYDHRYPLKLLLRLLRLPVERLPKQFYFNCRELIVGVTLAAVRRGVEARSFSNLMKLRAVVLTASQSGRTTHVVIRVTV